MQEVRLKLALKPQGQSGSVERKEEGDVVESRVHMSFLLSKHSLFHETVSCWLSYH